MSECGEGGGKFYLIFEEGETICAATGILFDSIAMVRSFLARDGNALLADRMVMVENILQDDGSRCVVYCILTGAARHVHHYMGVRKAGSNASPRGFPHLAHENMVK